MNIGIFYYVGQLLYNWNFNGGITVIPWGAFIFGLTALILLNLVLFFFPNILYGLPRMDYTILKKSTTLAINSSDSVDLSKSVKDFEISIEKLELIDSKLKEYALTNPYINPDFNLTIMSNDTNIPKHHISYFFKMYLKSDFIEWKNKARVEFAISIINSGEAERRRLQRGKCVPPKLRPLNLQLVPAVSVPGLVGLAESSVAVRPLVEHPAGCGPLW
jgi:hypothetical protein